jgi:hypothetical protein
MSEKTYLTPDELSFAGDDRVRTLGDDRYVVAATGSGDGRGERTAQSGDPSGPREETAGATPEADDSAGAPSRDRYFIDVRVRTDEGTDAVCVDGDDLRDVFVRTLRWYARRVSPEDDPATVVDVLLSGTEFDRDATGRVPDR